MNRFSVCGFEGTYLQVYSSIAQSVEHAAVNRAVVGSSPTRGAYKDCKQFPCLQSFEDLAPL